MKIKTNVQHSIKEFGILEVTMSGIRVEKIPVRVKPAVPFPHKHDFYQIMFITSGSGSHQIDFKKYSIKPHQIYIMKPGQIHSWQLSRNIDGFIIEFNLDSLQEENFGGMSLLGQVPFLPDLLELKTGVQKNIKKIIEVMDEEFQTKSLFNDLCLRNYLSGLLLQFIRENKTIEAEDRKHFASPERFRLMVENHFRSEHRVEFYARELKLTPKALTMQVSRTYGRSPRALIQDRCLLEAKRYLAFSSLSIAEIGYELGFEDANYFTRFFRSHEKITPVQFRKKLKN